MELEKRYASLASFSAEGDGMTFSGIAIPYNQVTTIHGETRGGPYDETFRLGAFAKTLAERWHGKPVPLFQSHDYSRFGIGVAETLEETPEGLRGTWRLSDVQAGRDAATLIRDQVVTGLSVGFEPLKSNTIKASQRGESRNLVERTEVRLREVSLCAFPAYEGALVTAQRSENGRRLEDLAAARLVLVDRFGHIQR